MRRFLTPVVVLACLVFSSATAGAVASTRALVPLTDAAQQLTAYGGYVVFSQSDAAQTSWHLMVWHAGKISALPVAPRSIPFDADAGPDAQGRPAVVYSRCTSEPIPFSKDTSSYPSGYPPMDWAQASGCRIFELSLLEGGERRATGIAAHGASDSTPSIWNGAIAFQRNAATAVPRTAKLFLWRAGRPLRRLAGGSRGEVGAFVVSMDLGAHELAFDWELFGGNVVHFVAWEVRSDPLGVGRPRLADVGIGHEACTGGVTSMPFSPNADGTQIFYVIAVGDPCSAPSSMFESFAPSTGRWRTFAPSTGLIGAAARDGASTYWVQVRLAPSPPPTTTEKEQNQGDCLPQHETCTLMQTTNLALKPDSHHYEVSPPLY